MKELNEKLARWAGFRPPTQEEYSPGSRPQPDMEKRGWGFMYPSGEIKWYLPNFASSLDACFKWLVPKLLAEGLSLHVTASERGYLSAVYGGSEYYSSREETPALALCKAIEQLIDKETKDE